MKKEPAYKSCHGRIRANVWINYRHDSPPSYRVSLSRFSAHSQSFKPLRSFDQDDAFSVTKIVIDCYNWIDYQMKARALRSKQ